MLFGVPFRMKHINTCCLHVLLKWSLTSRWLRLLDDIIVYQCLGISLLFRAVAHWELWCRYIYQHNRETLVFTKLSSWNNFNTTSKHTSHLKNMYAALSEANWQPTYTPFDFEGTRPTLLNHILGPLVALRIFRFPEKHGKTRESNAPTVLCSWSSIAMSS